MSRRAEKIGTMGSRTIAPLQFFCASSCSPSCLDSKTKRRHRAAGCHGLSSAQGLKSTLHFSPFFFWEQVSRVRLLRPIAPYCWSSQSDLIRNANPRGRAQDRSGSPGQLSTAWKWSSACHANALGRSLAGMVGATASVTNMTLGNQEDGAPLPKPVADPPQLLPIQRIPLLARWKPPRYMWRSAACLIIAGQVVMRVIRGKIHLRNSIQQLESVGPKSLGVSLLTASFVGMVFTIQFVREFARLGLTRSVGGVLALALARELSPVVTAIILAGRVGSAFAAELGTMQVSEQTDTLRVLRTDPVDYLITPRVIACCISLPILTIICFTVGMGASVLLADSVYNVSSNIILESAARALQPWDLISTSIKSMVFGGIISIVSCSWGVTTSGGAKGVGESTTSAVVISLVCIFIADFILSWCFFQGAGDALKAAMG